MNKARRALRKVNAIQRLIVPVQVYNLTMVMKNIADAVLNANRPGAFKIRN